MTPTATTTDPCCAQRLHLTGRVQGVGMRPYIVRLAQQLSIAGSVRNTGNGVTIHAEGSRTAVKEFTNRLRKTPPPGSEIESIQTEPAPVGQHESFVVEVDLEAETANDVAPPAARIPLDRGVCPDCLDEINNPSERRFQYDFTTCTVCGPRYSILKRLPFERADTAMAQFPLCAACQRDYESSADRRFHAETIACSACGPRIWFRDRDGFELRDAQRALDAALTMLRADRIIALRGVGGYQLLADAKSQDAVQRLRARKGRAAKPLAIMVASLADARRVAVLDDAETRALRDPANPIVLLRQRDDSTLARDVTQGLDTIGVMLPTSPLHWKLLDRFAGPLVCTSGNREGEPLAFEIAHAERSLDAVADAWLHHDRPIERPIDDSVTRVIGGRVTTIRLGRGLAPLPLDLDIRTPCLALGGHQKQSVAIANGRQAVLAAHLGDLDTLAARDRMGEQIHCLSQLLGMPDERRIACDMHPGYFTSEMAASLTDWPVRVQHHHAHVVAAAIEPGLLDQPVLGVAFDGTGWAEDGSVWGGEFLFSTVHGFRRVASLRPFRLGGGEQAVRQPWRIATALVKEALGREEAARLPFSSGDAAQLLAILERPAFSPSSTSAGRLFDGVAALALDVEQSQFEGQAAMLLESACDVNAEGAYELPLRSDSQPTAQLDWRPLIRQLVRDKRSGAEAGAMAMRFHRGLAQAIVAVGERFVGLPMLLSGGVFQNRVLTELVVNATGARQQPVHWGGAVPVNDGGLAAGQLAIAANCNSSH